MESVMKIMISGSHGLVGSILAEKFKYEGFDIIRLNRSFKEPLDFTDVKAVIHLAGEGIADGRWSTKKKEQD
jgi:NAD dependent epimerase/dehydratase family enzyme